MSKEAEENLRGAIHEITHEALPKVGEVLTVQSRARAQVQIAEEVARLNKAGGLWYRRWHRCWTAKGTPNDH